MNHLILIILMFTILIFIIMLFITFIIKYFYNDIINFRRIIPSNNRIDFLNRLIILNNMRSIIREEHYKKQVEINKQIKECIIIINPDQNINLGFKQKN